MKKVLLVFVIAGLALAGCGGSSAKDEADSGSSNTTTAGGGGNSSDAFDKLLELNEGNALRVTYDYGDDEDDQITISRDGAGKVAYLRGDEHAIFDGDSVISCENIGSTPECKEFSGQQATALRSSYTGFLGFATSILTAVSKVPDAYGDQSSETIAGRDANCATITAASAPGIAGNILGKIDAIADAGYKVCADDETGILLKFETVGVDDDQKQVIVATEVGEPKDSDFEPPATPESVPEVSLPEVTLPGGITLPSIPGVNP